MAKLSTLNLTPLNLPRPTPVEESLSKAIEAAFKGSDWSPPHAGVTVARDGRGTIIATCRACRETWRVEALPKPGAYDFDPADWGNGECTDGW